MEYSLKYQKIYKKSTGFPLPWLNNVTIACNTFTGNPAVWTEGGTSEG
jgi:hypothetical protein